MSNHTGHEDSPDHMPIIKFHEKRFQNQVFQDALVGQIEKQGCEKDKSPEKKSD
jgi:hypothetical protein